MAAFAAYLPLIAAGVGTVAQMNAQDQEARDLRDKANYDAAMQQRLAIQDEANAQVAADAERKKSREVQGRAMALAAASGAGASDPQVTGLISDIEARGNLNARARLYEGQTMAQSRRDQAGLIDFESQMVQRRAKNQKTATLISGASKMASYYG